LGRALFAAALGSHDLNRVIDGLNDEADALFKPHGSKQRINAAVTALNECRRQIREQSLKPAQWQQHSEALQQSRQQLALLEQTLADQRRELTRLQRIARLQPRFAARRAQQAALAGLEAVVLLGDDFGRRRQQALTDRARAAAVLDAARPRLEKLQQGLAKLSVNQPLLEQAEAIETLHTRIGAEAKARHDRMGLISKQQSLCQEAARLLATLRPDLDMDRLESLRPLLVKRHSIHELGVQQRLLAEKLQQAQQRQRGLEGKLQALQRAPAGADAGIDEQAIAALRRAIKLARRVGDLDATMDSAGRQLQTLQRHCSDAMRRAGLAERAADSLTALALPGRETITRFEQRYARLTQRRDRLDDQRHRLADELHAVERDIDQQQRAGSIPTEADLQQLRGQRDRLWRLLRRHWVGGEEVGAALDAGDTPADLPDRFEQRISSADELADRLRREADRVQALAALQASRDALRQRVDALQQQLAAVAGEHSQLDGDWQAQWRDGPASLLASAATPVEMRAWLGDFERLREQLTLLAQQRRDADAGQQTRAAHIAELQQRLIAAGQLAAPGDSTGQALEPLLQEAEARLHDVEQQRLQQQQRQHDQQRLQQDLADNGGALQQAQQGLAEWREQWRDALSDSGLDGDSSPIQAEQFLDQLARLFELQKDANERQHRIDDIDRDAAEFAELVAILLQQVEADPTRLAELGADEAVRQLNRQLSQSQAALKSQQQLQGQLQSTVQEIEQAELQTDTASRLLAVLADEAGCEHSDAALLAAEQQSLDKATTSAALADLERHILADGGGATLAELDAETAGIDADALAASSAQLKERIEQQLEPRRNELAETIGGQQKELDQMDGSAAVAELAEQAQALLAGIRTDGERYVRVKLAARILRDQIERYRKANQGPLVKRASEHFAVLTLGSFERLTIDFNDKDQAVLAGVRPQGARVQVQGMSAGTRDQLYLALRLASLEKYIHSAEPLPFIVDDVLVDFDDQRAAAALQALADLAGQTQVILFTHHARLVEQARQLSPAAHIHTL
jgi:uncharacterized protein YhaN